MKERGLTLVELLVSLAVLGMILAAVVGVVILQHKSYGVESDLVVAQQTARRVMRTLESMISMAGFGVDPPIAFDTSYYCCQSGYINPDTCPGASPYPGCRDRTDAPDEIVFLYREPDPMGWGETRNIEVVEGRFESAEVEFPSLTVANVKRGTILLFSCKNAAGMYNYIVVGSVNPAGTTNTITVMPHESRVVTNISHGGEGTFLQSAVVPLNHSCFSLYGAWVFPIRLARIYIEEFDTDGDGVNDTPFLMLDDGIGRSVLAQDVEDFQVAYIMANGSVIGSAPGRQELPDPTDFLNCPNDYFGGRKYYLLPADDQCRKNKNPANIRAVRITIVVRTPLPDPDIIGVDKPSLENPIENREGISDEEKRTKYPYRRVVLSTTVFVPNMLSNAQFSILSASQ